MTRRRPLALVWEALALELALYRSLARWVVRRPDVPAGTTPIGYAQLVGPMLWLWIFGSATEVVAIELVLREVEAAWAQAVRLPLLGIGVWGVLWMVGMMASYRVRPHLLADDRLRVRNGARTWVEVPVSAVLAAHPREHQFPGLVRSVHHEAGTLLIGVSSRTNLELELTRPTVLHTSRGEMTVERVGLWVDAPRDVARQLGMLAAARP